MPSDEVRIQKQRLERLAREECPGFTMAFDENDLANIRFSLQRVATGKRSGHSTSASGAQIRDKDEQRLRKLMRIMAEQCER